jgi:hypothetical protein
MSARHVAGLVSLLSFGFCTGWAEPVSSPDRKVVVYLQAGLSLKPNNTVPYMQRELETLMQAAGYKVAWKTPGNPSDEGDSVIAVVELRGSCKPPEAKAHIKPVENGASLASTAVDGGHVLPFSWINCETLTQMLAPSLAGVKSGQRDFLYGRAMGRLLAHELYHMLANQREHVGSGVGKPSFSAKDVLGESFAFEESALARFRGSGPSVVTEQASTEEEDIGR